MPGQLRLTGANAAYILEGSDTITEDVVVKFPEDGNYVTEDSDGNVDLDGGITAAGKVFAGSTETKDITPLVSVNTSEKATLFLRNKKTGNTALLIEGRQGTSTNTTFKVTAAGVVTADNVTFSLDPDDETKVLDVKESIRNMQSALYRLKAAVLIPDTTVDQLRLRILEALETITEEVD